MSIHALLAVALVVPAIANGTTRPSLHEYAAVDDTVRATVVRQPHGWVTMLGADTVQVEQAERVGNQIHGLLVTRAPTPRVLRYQLILGADGELQRYEQFDAHAAPGVVDPSYSLMEFTRDSIIRRAVVRGAMVTHRIAAPHGGFPFGTIPLGSSFQVLELALARVRRTTNDSAATVVRLSPSGFQPAPSGTKVLYAAADSVDVDYFGQGRFGVKFDAMGRLIRSDWRGTTYQVRVERVASIEAAVVGERWRDAANAGRAFGAISPRDTSLAQLEGASIRITYGRPAKRGRHIWGGVVPWDRVWRLGADVATHFETSADLRLGDAIIPAGRYTLWMFPTANGAQLIVSRLVDVFGTQYVATADVVRVTMVRRGLAHDEERLRIAVHDGQLIVAWGDASYGVAIAERQLTPAL